MKKTATNESWKNHPIDQPRRIEVDWHFSREQFSSMKQGYIPKDMEEKWFIYFENDRLYFHRSWTGYGIYSASVKKEDDGCRIFEFLAERNPDKYRQADDDADKKLLMHLIDLLLHG